MDLKYVEANLADWLRRDRFQEDTDRILSVLEGFGEKYLYRLMTIFGWFGMHYTRDIALQILMDYGFLKKVGDGVDLPPEEELLDWIERVLLPAKAYIRDTDYAYLHELLKHVNDETDFQALMREVESKTGSLQVPA